MTDTRIVDPERRHPENTRIVEAPSEQGDLTERELTDIDLAGISVEDTTSRESAKAEILQTAQVSIRENVMQAVDSQEADPAAVATTIIDAGSKQQMWTESSEFTYEESQAVANPDVSAAQMRYESNFNVASTLLNQAFEDEEEAQSFRWVDATLDFLDDLARDMTVGVKEAFEERLQADSLKVMYWAATMEPEAFRSEFQVLLDDYKTQGFIREDNVWGLVRLQQALFNQGVDGEADMRKFWAVVNVVDVAGITTASLKVAGRGAVAATSRIGRKAVTEGTEAAVDFAKSKLNDVDPALSVDLDPPALTPTGNRQPVEVPSGRWALIRQENEMIRRSEQILENANVVFTTDEAKAAITEYTERLTQSIPKTKFTVDSVEINYKDFDAPRLVGTITSRSGKPFWPSKAGDGPGAYAIKAAERTGGKVIAIDPSDPSKGYKVVVTTNVKFTDHIDSIDQLDLNYEAFKTASYAANREVLDKNAALQTSVVGTLGAVDSVLNGITNSGLFRVAASASSRSVKRNTAAIDLADRNLSVIKAKVIDPELNRFKRLPVSDRQAIDDIATEVRDGMFVENRDWLSETEFAAEFERRTGKAAEAKHIENYNRIIDLWDLVAYTEAKSRLGRFIELDYKSLRVGNWNSAGREFPASAIDKDTLVYHAGTQQFLPRGELESGSVIWSTIDWFQSGTERAAYIVTDKVDELRLDDVMGYNAGGNRINNEAKYFVGGQLPDDMPRIYLSASTEKQAKRTMKELRSLQEAYKNHTLTDDVFIANSDHLGDRFRDADEFKAFVNDEWAGFGSYEFQYKARDTEFVFKSSEAHKKLFEGLSSAEYAQMSHSRSNRMLEHFGGDTTAQMSSLTTLERSLSSSLQEMAFRSANLQAATGLVKAIRKSFPDALKGVSAPEGDTISQLFQANIPTELKLGRQLNEQRNIIMRRMGVKSHITKAISQAGKSLTETITDSAGSVAKALGKSEPQRVVDVNVDQLAGKALGLNHTLAFIASPFQFLLQSSHVANIMFIAPKSGLRGAAMASQMRSVLNSYTGQGERMVAGARLAKYMGYSQEQMDEIIRIAWKWGPDVIDGENLENGMGHTYGLAVNGKLPGQLKEAWDAAKKTGKAVTNVAMWPYNAGERYAQMTSFFTAVDEFIKKNPGKALDTADALQAISERANHLNFNMRRTSRSAVQQGLAAIPMQFMTYVLRAGEAVLVGRGFTAGERARLLAGMTLLYGATGLGVEKKMDTPENPQEVLLKYGVLDAIFSVFGLDTAVAPRMSVVGGYLDMYRRIKEDSLLEVLGGPTASLGIHALGAFASVIGSLSGRGFYTLDEELVTMIRSAAGGNNLVAAIGIYKHGVLTSRNGTSQFSDLGFSTTEALLKLLGVTTLKETEFWNAKEVLWRQEADVRAETKALSPKFEALAIRLRTAYQAQDMQEVERLEGEMKMLILRLDFVLPGMGYSRSQVDRIRRSVLRPDSPGFQALLDSARENGFENNLATLTNNK